MERSVGARIVVGSAAAVLFLLLGPLAGSLDAQAIPAWSRKYHVQCQLCHTPAFARLNLYGERFLWFGYQNPDVAPPDGDTEGKQSLSGQLPLDAMVGHWLTARLNLTPIQLEPKALVVEGEQRTRVTLGNPNWLQLFVAGSLAKDVSLYIENEFSSEAFHQAWFYFGLHNLLRSTWTNLQVGRLSPVVFAPYPDRLPQLPAVGRGILRVPTSAGEGGASLDMRSPRYGAQYYGYGGPLLLYAGLTPGPSPSNAAGNLGWWGGVRAFVPAGAAPAIEGSSAGLHYDAGTDFTDPAGVNVGNDYSRLMVSANLRAADLDLQGAYVRAEEDNRVLDPETPREVTYDGVRAVGSYFLNDRWFVSFHYDNYGADEEDQDLVPDYHFLYFPALSYLVRENIRFTFYPGFDLRDVDGDAKRHIFLLNVRAAI